MPTKKALFWSIFWVVISLFATVGVYFYYDEQGEQKALEFLTGYIIEKSLSVDNLFVFVMLFSYFNVESRIQRRVLNWGLIGVVILRGALILLGAAIINQFAWVLYIFGVILIYSGYRMSFGEEKPVEPEKNKVLRLFKKFMPIANDYHGERFFIKHGTTLFATSLFVVLLVVETTDVVFAVDSIPAIFVITTDPVIVFGSNFLAVLGLRSLYFLLAKVPELFAVVKKGVGIILVFVGIKMLIVHYVKIPIGISLAVVGSLLLLSVIISILLKKKESSAVTTDSV
jgi:tellurite resistance protein TerC